MGKNIIEVGPLLRKNVDDIDYFLDRAWTSRTTINKIIGRLISARIAYTISKHIPEAKTIIIREDTSHLPAHGHVDDILDDKGNSLLMDSETWHSFYWTGEVDDDVYDLYEMLSHHFMSEDNSSTRKLVISL